jgi:Domain of unknown function (DUF5666)
MNTKPNTSLYTRFQPWAAALATGVLLAACGGGGSSSTAGVGTGGTGSSYADGRISGFGSIIVNGVRYDDSRATVTDDDSVGFSKDDLKLGMVVGVQGGSLVDDSATGLSNGTATAIQFVSELKGLVNAKTASTLTVMGQTVNIDNATVFDGYAAGLTSVLVSDQVEVYALFDAATNTYLATRIEKKTGLAVFKISGAISSLNTTNKTFVLGNAPTAQTVSYAGIGAAQLPALSNGLRVRVKVGTSQVSGAWVASQVRSGVPSLPNSAVAELEGIVSDFVSLSNFKLNGVSVNAGGSVTYEDGTSANVVNGQRIEVKGTVQNGVLVASKVEVKNASGSDVEVKLIGAITSANQGASTFVLKGVTVQYDPTGATTEFKDGVVSALTAGRNVEVEGTLISGTSDVQASKVKFK